MSCFTSTHCYTHLLRSTAAPTNEANSGCGANHDAIRPHRRRAAGSNPAMAMPGDVAAFYFTTTVVPTGTRRDLPRPRSASGNSRTIPPHRPSPHRTPSARAVPHTHQLARWRCRSSRYHHLQNLQRTSRRMTTPSSSPSSERLRASVDRSPTEAKGCRNEDVYKPACRRSGRRSHGPGRSPGHAERRTRMRAKMRCGAGIHGDVAWFALGRAAR